jgi:hypothetical protein
LPDASKLISALNGLEQLTGTGLPETAIVGWPGSLLHCRITPRPAVYPEPLTLTDCPFVRPVDGLTSTAWAADAGDTIAITSDIAPMAIRATPARRRRVVDGVVCMVRTLQLAFSTVVRCARRTARGVSSGLAQ